MITGKQDSEFSLSNNQESEAQLELFCLSMLTNYNSLHKLPLNISS